jgi:hypothetical protein
MRLLTLTLYHALSACAVQLCVVLPVAQVSGAPEGWGLSEDSWDSLVMIGSRPLLQLLLLAYTGSLAAYNICGMVTTGDCCSRCLLCKSSRTLARKQESKQRHPTPSGKAAHACDAIVTSCSVCCSGQHQPSACIAAAATTYPSCLLSSARASSVPWKHACQHDHVLVSHSINIIDAARLRGEGSTQHSS